MKNYAMLFIVTIMGVFLMACDPADSEDPTYRVIKGTITVADNSYWSNLELGVFSAGTAGDYPEIDSDDNGNGVDQYRVYYSLNDDSADVSCAPLSGGSYSISDTSGTSSAYTFELPSNLPDTDEEYILATWYDADSGNDLDLKDMDPFLDDTVTDDGEFNRLATKATIDGDNNPTTVVIMSFMEAEDLSGNPNGNYKYYGYDNASYNEYMELDSSNTSGFNFAITANTGW